MFTPTVLEPTPDPFYVKEIKAIDPALRIVWGMARYFVECFVVERKISPERYYAMYRLFFESGQERYIDRPIYDDDQPLYDEEGNRSGSKIVGYNRFDLAPEYEWVMFVEEPDHSYRALDSRLVLELKRMYAWDRFHSFSRMRFEKKREEEAKEKSRQSRRLDAIREGIDEAYTESGWRESVSVPAVPE